MATSARRHQGRGSGPRRMHHSIIKPRRDRGTPLQKNYRKPLLWVGALRCFFWPIAEAFTLCDRPRYPTACRQRRGQHVLRYPSDERVECPAAPIYGCKYEGSAGGERTDDALASLPPPHPSFSSRSRRLRRLPHEEHPVLIDLRPPGQFLDRHLAGSASIPAASLRMEIYQLPAPEEDVVHLLGSSEDLALAADGVLRPGGWTVGASLNSGERRDWDAAVGAGWTVSFAGRTAANAAEDGDAAAIEEAVRRWSTPPTRGNAFLREATDPTSPLGAAVRDAVGRVEASIDPAAAGTRLLALDLGCGNGRDCVHLAGTLGPRWTVVGLDEHPGALGRMERLASGAMGAGASERRCVPVRVDLRKDGALTRALEGRFGPRRPAGRSAPGWTVGLVHGSRFLHRRLIRACRDDLLVEAGSAFFWSHFTSPLGGEENPAPPYRPSRRLERGELGRAFRRVEELWDAEVTPSAQKFEFVGDDAGKWSVLSERIVTLRTRGEQIPATFFVAVRDR